MAAIATGSHHGRICRNRTSRVSAAMSMNGVSWWLEAMAAISGRRAITSTRRVAADRGGWLPERRPYGAGHWGTAATPAAWPLADGTPGPPHPAETTAGRRVT